MSIIDDQQAATRVGNASNTPTATAPSVRWSVIGGVPQLALIAHRGDSPAAVVEPDGRASYRLTTSRGIILGSFPTIGEAQEAFAAYIAVHG